MAVFHSRLWGLVSASSADLGSQTSGFRSAWLLNPRGKSRSSSSQLFVPMTRTQAQDPQLGVILELWALLIKRSDRRSPVVLDGLSSRMEFRTASRMMVHAAPRVAPRVGWRLGWRLLVAASRMASRVASPRRCSSRFPSLMRVLLRSFGCF